MHRQDLGLVLTLVVGEDEERERVRRAIRRAPTSACACVGELPTNDRGIDLRAL
jgi:hypothetical protein